MGDGSVSVHHKLDAAEKNKEIVYTIVIVMKLTLNKNEQMSIKITQI